MPNLESHIIPVLVLVFILYLILRSLPRLIGIPAVILILAVLFPNDRLVQATWRVIEQFLGVIILVGIVWYGVLAGRGRGRGK